ncbi:MAG: BTAD domain-containing putative transcriptional regulator [Chloroflexota bacterium]
MKFLKISLFGTFHIQKPDETEIRFRSGRILGLLSFLISEADCSHNREKLLALIWPETSGDLARSNFRVALHRIRKAMDQDSIQDNKYILTTTSTVQFNPDSDYWLDTNTFTETITTCQQAQNQMGRLDKDQIVLLEQALEIYKGDFLSNVDISSERFEEWLYAKRETYHRAAIWACIILSENYIRQKSWQPALAIAYRQISLEPWVDEGHRQVIKMLIMTGQPGAAIEHFKKFSKDLADEIGVDPQPETKRLYDDIKNGTWNAESLSQRIRRFHFPTDFSPFVGREEDLTQIIRWLEAPHCRLISLVGSGGVGKTRLATQASIRISENQKVDFPAGIYFIPLEEVITLDGFISNITKALDIPIVPGETLKSALLKHLRKKKLLLVFDNFEHLMPMKDLVMSILQSAPGVKIIITSREHLGFQAEWILSVYGLPFPQSLDVENPESFPAVKFFIQSVRRIQPGLSNALAQKTEAIIRICQLVEGLPLALELAANWVPVLSFTEIAAGIGQGIGIMQTNNLDVPERHRSMETVFDYSWALLPPRHQELLEHLSLFSGEFDRQAAEIIANASLSGLAALVQKSFLHRSTVTGKYHIHPLLKQFARKRLAAREKQKEESESSLVRQRYSQYYLGQIIQQKDDLMLRNSWQDIKKHQAELPHLHQAWRWAVEHRDFETIGQSSTALAVIYLHLGLYSDGFAVLDMAIANLRNLMQQEDDPAPDLKRTLGRLLVETAGFWSFLNEIGKSEELAQEAWEIGQETADFYIQMKSQYWIGNARFYLSEISESMEHIKKIDQILQNPDLEGSAGEKALAQMFLRDAVGKVSLFSGDYAVAEDNLIAAVNQFRFYDNALLQAYSLLSLCNLYLKRFYFDLAHQKIEQAQKIFDQEQYPRGHGHLLFTRGELYVSLGDWKRSFEYFQQSNDISDSISENLNFPLYHNQLGLIFAGQNDLLQAQQHFERSVHISRALNQKLEEADSTYGLGIVAEKSGDIKKAEKHFHDSLTIKNTLALFIPPLESLAGLARLALLDDTDENINESLGYVEEILAYLEKSPRLEGIIFPTEIYLTCYQVLKAAGDPRAPKLLTQGKKILYEMAANITDEGSREIFMKNISSNRRIFMLS